MGISIFAWRYREQTEVIHIQDRTQEGKVQHFCCLLGKSGAPSGCRLGRLDVHLLGSKCPGQSLQFYYVGIEPCL